MQEASADPRGQEPIQEGLKQSGLNLRVLEEFAQNMSENIIRSFINQREAVGSGVDSRASGLNQNQEMLTEELAEEFAEEFAKAVVEVALGEACRGQGHQEGSQSSAGVKTEGGLPFVEDTERERSTEMDPDAQPCGPSLSQSGLPVVGSLDYPDTPPTTPLLPELERSRDSFARKLKGGLAKVYPPSPPPPTPKDKMGDLDAATIDPQAQLIEHLMHSLSTNDLARDCFEVGPRTEAFAEALSRDIVDCVLSDRRRDQTDGGDLGLLAHRLAETIITSSLDEARILV